MGQPELIERTLPIKLVRHNTHLTVFEHSHYAARP